MGDPLETYYDEGRLVAMVLRGDQAMEPGVHFLTPSDLPLQLGYMNHPPGKVVTPHAHNHAVRSVENTSEVLLVRTGQMLVRLFKKGHDVLAEFTLGPGDLVFLCYGAHGFKALTALELVEVKQGPYLGEGDKSLLTHLSMT